MIGESKSSNIDHQDYVQNNIKTAAEQIVYPSNYFKFISENINVK